MNRRRLILGGAGLLGIAALGGWGIGHVAMRAEIVSLLQRRLGYLKLDPEGLRAFARDQTDAAFHKKIPSWSRLRYHFLAADLPSFKRFYRSSGTQSRVMHLEDNLVSTFLLSSDFFLHGADESNVVHYVAYYDPLRPCQNPFARPPLDFTAT